MQVWEWVIYAYVQYDITEGCLDELSANEWILAFDCKKWLWELPEGEQKGMCCAKEK